MIESFKNSQIQAANSEQKLDEGIFANLQQQVSELPLLTQRQRHQRLFEWNNTTKDYPQDKCMHQLFEEQVERSPSSVAVVFENQQLTYQELNRRANKLAHYLQSLGVGPEVLVGICVERSLELIIGLLGILKAGGSYIPLDPAYPKERLVFMLQDTNVSVILTKTQWLQTLPEVEASVVDLDTEWSKIKQESHANPVSDVTPQNVSYLIYTSGSTGKPKGVQMPHASVCHYIQAIAKMLPVNSNDVYLHTASFSFTASVRQLILPLSIGATSVIATREQTRTPLSLFELIQKRDVTVSDGVPSVWRYGLMALESLDKQYTEALSEAKLRLMVFGGELLPYQLVKKLRNLFKKTPHFFNILGQTETIGHSIYPIPEECDQQEGYVPVGRPLDGIQQIYVFDSNLQPVKVGEPGELHVAGCTLARGYLNRPEANAQKFISNPFYQHQRLFKTGDVARYLSDGTLQILGRIDFQVNIRGMRVELEEIESVLKLHPNVREAVVAAREDVPGDLRLIAYIVPHSASPQNNLAVDFGELRNFLNQKLPDYMVPNAFVLMDVLPVLPNGKLDRNALPAPDLSSYRNNFVPPRTPTEQVLANIWAEVLRLDQVGIYDNFLELGGHSLLASLVMSRLREAFYVELPVSTLFDSPTVASLSEQVEASRNQNQSQQLPSLQPVSRSLEQPLSLTQQRLWFLDQIEGPNAAYNIARALRLVGRLNLAVLKQAIEAIIQRHETLRTCFGIVNGQPVQAIAATLSFTLPRVDLQGLPEVEQSAEVQRLITQEYTSPFDLAKAPLLRVTLICLEEESYVLLVTMHHIISDAWSVEIFLKELSILYAAFLNGAASPLPELPIQYADYAYWQRQGFHREAIATQLAYWKQQLAGAPPIIELPTDRPRSAIETFRVSIQRFQLGSDLTHKLKILSQKSGASLFMTLLAAFVTLLSRYSGQDDIAIGSPITNRNRVVLESLIGFFVNTLVLRTKLQGNPTFRELLAQVRQVALDAYGHQDVPFEQLVEALQPQRHLSHSPLFQVMFVLQNSPVEKPQLPGLTAMQMELDRPTAGATFDLTLSLQETESELRGVFEYNANLFDAATIERMTRHFQTLLEGIVANPIQPISQLPLLTQAERQQLLFEWNNTFAEFPQDKCIHQLFEEQVELTPDAVALVFEGTQLTYLQLNARANTIAHYLLSLGVGPEVLVGICVERSLEMVVGLLGILKAGGAYVPLDPAYPSERLAFMLEDNAVPVLLTQEKLVEKLPQHSARVICLDSDWEEIHQHSNITIANQVTPDSLAYVMYTSGSTGQPKGVSVIHRGVVRLVKENNYANFSPEEVFLQLAPISFDASTLEIWGSLLNGARLVVMPPHTPSMHELGQTLKQHQVTTLLLTTGLFHLMVDQQIESLKNLRQLLAGGDVLSVSHLQKAVRELKGCRLINGYGPTENTTFTCCYAIIDPTELGNSVPIGRPIANTQVYLLDKKLQPVPIGVPGELYIGGDGLARGYLNRPDLTAEKFIPNPFSNQPSLSLYKTGDKARYLPDGNIEYLGRIDNQVKIRGFRIELGEIEAVLTQHPDVRETAVIARVNSAGDKQLVAYVVGHQEEVPTISDLRRFLKEQLPEYMVPSAFVVLEALPLTPNGKVDRRALPAPNLRKELEESFVAPRTPIEEMLASIWGNILLIDSVGVHDNFFTLGGHSLLATQVISRVRDTISIELPLRSLFEAPTIAEFASRVENLLSNGQSVQAEPLLPIPRSESIPLSFAQARLWFLDRLQPNSAFYNIPLALRLSGQLNIAALQSSINAIIQRHEALRTNFVTQEGQPVQVIASTKNLKLLVVDLLHLRESEREIEAQRLALVEANRPFNLEREPLLRGTVLQLGETEYVLLLTMHHIISDGWSLGVFVRELTQLYKAFCTGAPPNLPELPVQYADFTVWQRQWLQGEILVPQLDYWKEQLLDAPALLELPTDRPRPAVLTFRGGYYYAALSLELSAELTALSKRAGVTLFMTLFAAFVTLLYRYSGQDDIVVGTPVAGRNRQEIEGLIGFFVNTLVLRTDLSGNPSFEQLLGRVKEVALGAYANQDLPFEQLVKALQPERDLSYTPLFQVMFALNHALVPSVELPELAVSSYPVEIATAKFDLSLSMENTADGLVGVWEYNVDLFDETTIARMTGHFLTLLEGIVANPQQQVSQLPLLTLRERHQLLVEWNNTTKEYPFDKCIHQLFEEQVTRSPDAIAVVFEEEQLTYRELNQRANCLAHHLKTLGVEPEVLVGICVERSLEMIVGLLGILKAGGAYVPLDPAYPLERLALMLEDSAVPVLLTQQRLVDKLPQHEASVVCLDTQWEIIAQMSSQNLAGGVNAENLAYVIYTSGSTGKPKGVTIQHRSLVNYTTAIGIEYEIEKRCCEALLRSADRVASKERLRSMVEEHSAERVLQFASISFDASAEEIYTCLTSGATLVLRTDSMLDSVDIFLQKCRAWNLTVLSLPTAYWHELTARLSQETLVLPPSIRLIIIGGEKALPERLKTWQEYVGQRVRLVNTYGPTEATVVATRYELSTANRATIQLPIGRPISNVQTYILDRNGQPVPIGVPGELHIGGAGLACGYLNRPDFTDKQFIPNPFSHQPSSRLYKTGDLARYLPDGNIEFLGRLDNQVKIRGFRIELGEIEAAIAQYPGVRETVVVVREDIPGDKRLVAYIVPIQVPPTCRELRHFLLQKLPDYMVPNAIVVLCAMPLLPNGKVDRRALPAPDSSPSDSRGFVPPRDTVEQQLQRIWSEVLQHSTIGVHDNFFDLGGHSLLAVRLMARLEQHFGLNLPLATLLATPTIEQLASCLRANADSFSWSPLVAIQSGGDKRDKRPFFCVPGVGGNVIYFYELARHLGLDQPFYGFSAKGLDGESEPLIRVEDIAAYYIEAMQTLQPNGPYLLGGHSFGGVVAFEMAIQLHKQGHEVALVAIIDAIAPIVGNKPNCSDVDEVANLFDFASYIEYMFSLNLEVSKETLASFSHIEQLHYLKERLIRVNLLPPDAGITLVRGLVQVYMASLFAHRSYLPLEVLPTHIALFRAQDIDEKEGDIEELLQVLKEPTLGWKERSGTVDVHLVPGNHMTMMAIPQVQVLAEQLRVALEQAQTHLAGL